MLHKRNKWLIYTVDIGVEDYTNITNTPMSNYANRIGADFYTCRNTTRKSPYHAKYDIFSEACAIGYEKVLYLDSDVLIRRGVPNIFEHYTNALFNEIPLKEKYEIYDIVKIMINIGDKKFDSNCPFYNSGVILFDNFGLQKLNKEFENIKDSTIHDQYNLNNILRKIDLPIQHLNQRWNTNGGYRIPYDEPTLIDSYFIHVSKLELEKRIEKLNMINTMFP